MSGRLQSWGERGLYRAGVEWASTEPWRVGDYRPEVSGCLYSRGNCGLYGAGVTGFPHSRGDWGLYTARVSGVSAELER